MGLSESDIGRVVSALSPHKGSLLQGVFQPAPDRIVLSLWRPGFRANLLCVYRGDLTRLHTIVRRPPNPKTGSAFQQLLRKHLSGPLTDIRQVGQDRIVDLVFGSLTLRFELSGRHGNLFLLDEQLTIQGRALKSLSKLRQLNLQGPYALPEGLTPSHSKKSPFSPTLQGKELLDAMESHFLETEAKAHYNRLEGILSQRLRSHIKKATRRLKNLEKDMEKAATAQDQRRFADLIQISLNTLTKGDSIIQVSDIFQSPPVMIEIPMDPALSPKGNMARFYSRAKRYERGEEQILSRAEEAEETLAHLGIQLQTLKNTKTLEGLENLAFDIPAALRQSRPKTSKKAPLRCPYKRYQSPTGQIIRVGRGAKDNDALTFKHSKGNDIWMHIRGAPGAHVTLPNPGKSPSLEALLDGAAIALKYGGRPLGEDGEVSYTRVKFVKRAPGSGAGKVTFSQDKSLYLRLDAQRLKAINRLD